MRSFVWLYLWAVCVLLLAVATAAAQPVSVLYAGKIQEPSDPPKGTVVKVSEYLLVDGQKIGLKEWSDRPSTPGCAMCGPKCDCKACECTDSYWKFSCSAAGPKEKAAVLAKTKPVVAAGFVLEPTARSVPARATFPAVAKQTRHYECEFDPSHVCSQCGATQLVIAHWNRDGTHTHTCPRCGHSWRH